MKFKDYLALSEQEEKSSKDDVKKTISKMPKKHANLIKDYKIIFQPSNSLRQDDKHIGVINEKNKTITIAAPWNFSREFTLLHEMAHAVWKYLVDENKKREWKYIVEEKRTKQIKENPKCKSSLNQNAEEIFCSCYANFYCKHKNQTFNDPDWMSFIENL